jgi:class 3 adenylate cyclase
VALKAAPELHRVSLRFSDKAAERRFQDQYFRDNLPYIRAAHVVLIAAWAFFGLHFAPQIVLYTGLAIPIVVASLALTYTHWYARVWQLVIVALVVANSAVSEMHRLVTGHSPHWDGLVGLMLILALTFALLRLRYMCAASAAALVIGFYTATRVLSPHDGEVPTVAAVVYLVAFAVIGTAGAYALERFARVLFLRERQLDRERQRGDRLLRNILPEAIIDRLKTRDGRTGTGHIAQRYPDVTVLFADLVGFTEQAASTDPGEVVTALDDVFSRFDQLADRFGLEKIKTIGDAYMAAAGVPDSRPDHVAAAADMALEGRACVSGLRWPSGAPVGLRIGIACGPVMAGVIGRRKFAYDVWGDTVNTANRLESSAAPGSIQVSEAVYERLSARYLFSEPYVLQLKGKGPTSARILRERLQPIPHAAAGVQATSFTASGTVTS